MTTAQMLEHVAHAHDGATDSWLTIESREVCVHSALADGTSYRMPFGKVSEQGAFEAACAAAGVVSSRLAVKTSGAVCVELTYESGETEEEYLAAIDSPGAWRFIPVELFDSFEAALEEWEV